jgi:3',5'-cyclic AMP phosphodiesterase CpdA
MRTIAHVSDVHFGATDARIVEALVQAVNDLSPDVVAVSGDLTQRARRWQFERAREFLAQLPRPQIVVPGNHDVPLYHALARFAWPLAYYSKYITADLHPYFADDAIAVMGANTTRSFTIADGGLTAGEVARISARLGHLGEEVLKIIVCHHPFELPHTRSGRWTRPRPDPDAMATLTGKGADLFLTGHLHIGYAGDTAVRYKGGGRVAIVVEAGTAASTRRRGETNSFNVIRADHGRVTVERRVWDESARQFVPGVSMSFRRSGEGWAATENDATSVSSTPSLRDR